MVADDGLVGAGEQTGKGDDLSATIFVIGKVENYKAGLVHLSGRTVFDCRLAIKEFYQRTRIVKHYGADGVITRRTAGKVILVATSFDRRKRERIEAVIKVSDHLTRLEDIPADQVIKAMDGEGIQGVMTIREVAVAIQEGKYPQNVIIAGDEPMFRWFNTLDRILKKQGVNPQYLREYRVPLPAYA